MKTSSETPYSVEDLPQNFLKIFLYEIRFGNFMCNTVQEREKENVMRTTVSIWAFLDAIQDEYRNPQYNEYSEVGWWFCSQGWLLKIDIDICKKTNYRNMANENCRQFLLLVLSELKRIYPLFFIRGRRYA